jgi:hypothetical protein
MKKLDLKLIQRESFCNQRSYEAAIYAATIINRMLALSKQGHLILSYENVVKLNARIELDALGEFQFIMIGDHEEANVMLVGDETMEFGDTSKIYCTKKTIREFFKLWRVCRITNVVKATDLT